MKYAAEINALGKVLQVLVVPDNEPDPAAYIANLGIPGQWVNCETLPAPKYVYIFENGEFAPPQPAFNYDLNTQQARWEFPPDNHLYIPAAPHIAERLSRALYSLIVPGGDGLYAGVIPHPSGQGYPLLQCRSTDIIPVAIGCDPEPLSDVLQITVDDAALTQAEKDGIVAAVQALAGQQVQLIDFIPPSWQPFVMTREQAEAAGYFNWE
jgi:hypothetical protein